jgi:rhodanese-related sulfurtransferase
MINETKIASVSVAEVKAGLETGAVQVVDVRPSFDFAGGRIPGSVSLPYRSLTSRAEHLDRNRQVLFLSEDGSQGEAAVLLALSIGFTNVANIEGGYDAWVDAGYPSHTIDNGT